MYSVYFPSFNSYGHCAFLGEPDEFFCGRGLLKSWLEDLEGCNSWFCWGFFVYFGIFLFACSGGCFTSSHQTKT